MSALEQKQPTRLFSIVWGALCLCALFWSGFVACEPGKELPGESSVSDAAPDLPLVIPDPIKVYKPAHLEPTGRTPLKLSYEVFDLPASLGADISILVLDNEVWIGGQAGLFRLQNGTLKQEDTRPVTGLAAWKDSNDKSQVVIAHKESLDVWFRGLVPSSLNNKLGQVEIQTLHSRGNADMWIGTKTALWRVQGENLLRFDQIQDVRSIQSNLLVNALVLRTGDGKILVMRADQSGEWSVRDLTKEGPLSFQWLMPLPNNEFWGAADGHLYLRKAEQDGVAWWPFILQPNPVTDDKGSIPPVDEAWKVENMLTNPATGVTWMLTAKQLIQMNSKLEAKVLERPKELVEAIKFALITSDESLWLSDGKKLLRFGQKQLPLTYTDDIAPFIQQSCLRCHKDGGIAGHFLLTNYDEVKKGLDAMIKRIEDGTMPPPPDKLLGGDADLLRRWEQEGLKQ